MKEYEHFCTFLPSGLGATLLECVPRGLIHCFMRGCCEKSKTVHAEVYETEGELWNSLSGPVFHCNMLANTTCDDPCDWTQIAEEPYDLNKMDTFSSIQKLLGRILVPEPKHLLQHEHLQLDDVSGGHGDQDCWGPGL